MTANAFLLNCFSMVLSGDVPGQTELVQQFFKGMLQRCGIQSDWVDALTWIYGRPLIGDDYSLRQEIPAFFWQCQPELDFTLLEAAVHKIACGNGHVLAFASQSGDAVHGCVLVSPAAAGRFNLLPAAELSVFYNSRRKNAGTAGEQALQLLEKADMVAEDINSLLLASSSPSDGGVEQFSYITDRDRQIVDYQTTLLLQYLAEKTAGYSGSDSQMDVMASISKNNIKHLMVAKKL